MLQHQPAANLQPISANCWSYYWNLFEEFLFQQTLDQNFWVGIWIVYMQGMQKWESEDWQKNLLYPITISSKDFVPHRLVVQDVFLRGDLSNGYVILQTFFKSLTRCQVFSFLPLRALDESRSISFDQEHRSNWVVFNPAET
jgi:hypothetical protein